ncbi:P63C domain-containing protein [Polynucleobacter sp. 71A-WALBACH]|uniref:P63C domain-containing protein n=1 Tax=Polynucleobacter sp. 71A-WALBACH TaxID=2689097 RepID=UPI001C0C4615|nr:P63C domain-containing protein [Polynucleobacter sp. 71A-WALBACH]MBU3592915.1 P63C domain-containing protein [Polynucleobacter sp. 71A-WALBACH]
MQAKDPSKQKGALARSAVLTPERRKEIATKAALKRAGYISASHSGNIVIGGASIPCAVLEDGRRVVWQREVVGLLTGNKKGGLGRYLSPANLEPYAPEKFKSGGFDETAISFEINGRKAHGFEAEDIVEICRMYMNARRANALLPSQIHLAAQAEIIVLSLAKVGITALIDEATGYQEIRDRKALQSLLDAYLKKEHAAWAKRFPDEFYREMFRLKDWVYPTVSGGKPGVVGRYTNDLVYERLAPGLLDELEHRNPKNESGYRKAKHHQWMTDDIGHPALATHIHSVMGLMRASDTWDQFMTMMNRSFVKKGDQIPLMLDI